MEALLKNLLYENPELYEEIYHGSDNEVPRMCERLFGQSPAGGPRTLLDIGCGTGRDLAYFAGTGIDCVGVDYQEAMITYACGCRPGIDFRIGDMRTLRLGRVFDAITCLGWAIANIHTNEDLSRVMATYAAHARVGTLLFLHLPNAIANLEGHGFPHDFVINTPTFTAYAEASYTLDRRNQLLARKRTWLIPGRPAQEDFVRFRLLFPQELELHLISHGFHVLGMYDNTRAADSSLTGSSLYVLARFGGG